MSYLNGIYIFCDKESYSGDMEVSEHPVENGTNITDTVKKNPEELSISGAIVDYDVNGEINKAATILSKIEALKNAGALIKYSGRRALNDMQIKGFSTDHDNKIAGGATFSMTLHKCRIVSNAYVPPKASDSTVKDGGQQQTDKGDNTDVYYTVKKGDCVAALVAEPKAPYKNLKRAGAKSGYWGACNWVMEKNPKAFSRAGDFRTLQIGAKLLLGAR